MRPAPGISGRSLLEKGGRAAQELHRVNAGPVRPGNDGAPPLSALCGPPVYFLAGFRHLPLFLITRVLQLSLALRFFVVGGGGGLLFLKRQCELEVLAQPRIDSGALESHSLVCISVLTL